jgi:hypothetical protein
VGWFDQGALAIVEYRVSRQAPKTEPMPSPHLDAVDALRRQLHPQRRTE